MSNSIVTPQFPHNSTTQSQGQVFEGKKGLICYYIFDVGRKTKATPHSRICESVVYQDYSLMNQFTWCNKKTA